MPSKPPVAKPSEFWNSVAYNCILTVHPQPSSVRHPRRKQASLFVLASNDASLRLTDLDMPGRIGIFPRPVGHIIFSPSVSRRQEAGDITVFW